MKKLLYILLLKWFSDLRINFLSLKERTDLPAGRQGVRSFIKKIRKPFCVVYILLLFPVLLSAQRIGEMAPDPKPEVFPPHAIGVDLLFGDGGFGLGGFYRLSFNQEITGFVNLSFSESKDDREVQFIDPYTGQIITFGKVNRVFTIPLNFGIKYRLFANQLTAVLRPFIDIGIGPDFILTTPESKDFFTAFGDAKLKVAAGGYIGFGADFGLSKTNLMGLNIRYYYAHLFGEGVESLKNRVRTNLGSVYITLSLGIMN